MITLIKVIYLNMRIVVLSKGHHLSEGKSRNLLWEYWACPM